MIPQSHCSWASSICRMIQSHTLQIISILGMQPALVWRNKNDIEKVNSLNGPPRLELNSGRCLKRNDIHFYMTVETCKMIWIGVRVDGCLCRDKIFNLSNNLSVYILSTIIGQCSRTQKTDTLQLAFHRTGDTCAGDVSSAFSGLEEELFHSVHSKLDPSISS